MAGETNKHKEPGGKNAPQIIYPIDRVAAMQKMRYFIKQLRNLCHHPNCSRQYDCPETHSKCKQQLNIVTASAWALAGWLNGYHVTAANGSRITLEYVHAIKIIKRTLRRILTLERKNISSTKQLHKFNSILTDIETWLCRLEEELKY